MKFPPYKYSFIIFKLTVGEKSNYVLIPRYPRSVVVFGSYSLTLQNIYITIYTLPIILTIIQL